MRERLIDDMTAAMAPKGTERFSPEWKFWRGRAQLALAALGRSRSHAVIPRNTVQFWIWDDATKSLRLREAARTGSNAD